MPGSKFDIYNKEWLEVVFEKRNKSYGAYDLRKHYAANMVKAMGITAILFIGIFIGFLLFSGTKQTTVTAPAKITEVDLTQKVIVIHSVSSAPSLLADHKLVKGKAGNIYPATVTGKSGIVTPRDSAVIRNNHSPVPTPATNNPASVLVTLRDEPGNNVIDIHAADIKPEPNGGAVGWVDFLQHNIQYPATAKINKVSGKVWLSFIIERDGCISNIVVEHAAGNGFDQEATRVLKLAPAWKPGIKNGQKVRVKYILPINFHIDG